MEWNERFWKTEQNIPALQIHRTGVSVLLLICMWISLLDCGTVRIMDVKMAAYEMKAMPSAVEAEKGDSDSRTLLSGMGENERFYGYR